MDYSKYTISIIINYLLIAGSILMIIVLSVIAEVYQAKAFIKQNKEMSGHKILFFSNKGSIIDFTGIFAFAVIIIIALHGLPDIIADIPYAINKEFSVTKGIVVGQNAAGLDDVSESRGFELKVLESGEIINLYVVYTPIRTGEIYEVIYLPHTKAGAIVKKIEDDDLT